MYNEVNTSPFRSFFHQTWVRIVLVLDFLAIVAVIGVAIYNSTKTAVVTFFVTPVDATITMGGTTCENGTYKFRPGSYDITISHPGLDSKILHLDLQNDSSTRITTFLSATGNDGQPSFDFYELRQNYDSYQALASIASSNNNQTFDHDTSAEEFIAKTEKILSFYSRLPIIDNIYAVPNVNTATTGISIRDALGNEKCQTIACLLVKYFGDGYQEVVAKKIKEAGYNPSDYEIIYERYL